MTHSSWRLSDEGDTCDESCAQIGLICKSDSFGRSIDQQTFEVTHDILITHVLFQVDHAANLLCAGLRIYLAYHQT